MCDGPNDFLISKKFHFHPIFSFNHNSMAFHLSYTFHKPHYWAPRSLCTVSCNPSISPIYWFNTLQTSCPLLFVDFLLLHISMHFYIYFGRIMWLKIDCMKWFLLIIILIGFNYTNVLNQLNSWLIAIYKQGPYMPIFIYFYFLYNPVILHAFYSIKDNVYKFNWGEVSESSLLLNF